MKSFIGLIVTLILWVTAVATDGNAGDFGWLAADILLWPVAVVRGLLMVFGIL